MRHRMGRTLFALAFGAASVSAVGAQALVPLPLGSRVRVQTRAGDTARVITGNVTVWENDTIALLLSAGAEQRIPLARVTRMDVSRGKGVVASHVLIGAGVGTVTGVLVGMAVGYNSCSDCFVKELTAITGAVTGGLIGGATGTIIGVAIKGERWRKVALERPALGVVPLRGGVALALSARF